MLHEPHGLSLSGRLGRDVWTLPALLEARAERSGASPALWSRDRTDGTWGSISWGEYRNRAAAITVGLKRLGLGAGEPVGIMAPSCQRWDLLQMGILAAGGVVVGMDPNDLDENLDSIARRCGLAGLVVPTPAWLMRFGSKVRDGLRFVLHLDAGPGDGRSIAYDALVRYGDAEPQPAWDSARADDPAIIVFTSGTTGAPKGIQYSHRQVCLAVASILDAFPDLDEGGRLACWLPLSNLFQRIVNALAVACAAQTYYVEDPREIVAHVGAIRPHLFIGVPRFYAKLQAAVMDRVDQGPAWQRALVAWALRIGDNHARVLREGGRPSGLHHTYYRLADRLALRRLRAVMGPNLRYMISGSAPMPIWLLERFHAVGLLVLEAYGLSENAIPVAANRPYAYRFGTVGRLMRGCDVRLAEDGELLVRGPGVVSAYYGEERTPLIDAEGYLATGDYATLDPDGFVTLTGRKSEIFKTATGRRIAPAGIESRLLQVPSVEHAVVFGANRPFLVAVVAVSAQASVREARGGTDDLLAYCKMLRQEIVGSLGPLPAYKRPAGLVVTIRPFSVEGGELTANLKLRRRMIAERYANELETLYRLIERAKGDPVLQAAAGGEQEVVLCGL